MVQNISDISMSVKPQKHEMQEDGPSFINALMEGAHGEHDPDPNRSSDGPSVDLTQRDVTADFIHVGSKL